jgi:hypothetical protein
MAATIVSNVKFDRFAGVVCRTAFISSIPFQVVCFGGENADIFRFSS